MHVDSFFFILVIPCGNVDPALIPPLELGYFQSYILAQLDPGMFHGHSKHSMGKTDG